MGIPFGRAAWPRPRLGKHDNPQEAPSTDDLDGEPPKYSGLGSRYNEEKGEVFFDNVNIKRRAVFPHRFSNGSAAGKPEGWRSFCAGGCSGQNRPGGSTDAAAGDEEVIEDPAGDHGGRQGQTRRDNGGGESRVGARGGRGGDNVSRCGNRSEDVQCMVPSVWYSQSTWNPRTVQYGCHAQPADMWVYSE